MRVLDLSGDDGDAVTRLLADLGADVLKLEPPGGNPGQAAAYGTSCADLADRFPQLVALSVTDFGTTGPRSSWRATVLYGLSG